MQVGLENIFERSVQDPCCLIEDEMDTYTEFPKYDYSHCQAGQDELHGYTSLRKYNSVPSIPLQHNTQHIIPVSPTQARDHTTRRRSSLYSADPSHTCRRSHSNANILCTPTQNRSKRNSLCSPHSSRPQEGPMRSRSQSVVAIPSHLLSIEKYITSELDTNISPTINPSTKANPPFLSSQSSSDSGSYTSDYTRPPTTRRRSSFKVSLASSFSS
ncbi:uncharacterized protein GVI51_K02365 [Nakaseomyces glabratus]|uniref:Uncharacterized protein n=2 Tax=Candida glabrata TaxID=5478 RepID=Q6FN59_CANGA|nr:uncharacterized protein CAGL0K02519g [Nakaseomyces glabratus]KAH7583012.1 Mitochondrial biogenesis regulation protein 1 [Nakaseomyces glabratus]KAH7584436.1 Mitochondrial biogenesis regulation protein 1 [Nakaseomyces glabratus]KAH7596036.1 Mitochondrial biogenesis regulation protein 1 [Nakaseomyces glabratus]KAH7596893.1 Mitochondrial biogenesis regulation protein 1 [Nakaseomyces glabratus]KAH7602664.1 Mitochondrial biogenesis regulation protein 1 [Nakaseomyces glabratus]|eukprot:XP_448335.1 uncharacterized protein CAGL0K02519g [[Candida] glabrata]